jgi:hypothetical protein
MATAWLILALLQLAMEGFGIYGLTKVHAGAMEYVFAGVALLGSLVLLYAAVVEGTTLAYVILAIAFLYVIRGIYGLATKSWISGGIGLAVGLLFAYWGYQRLMAASMFAPIAPTMGGGKYKRRR